MISEEDRAPVLAIHWKLNYNYTENKHREHRTAHNIQSDTYLQSLISPTSAHYLFNFFSFLPNLGVFWVSTSDPNTLWDRDRGQYSGLFYLHCLGYFTFLCLNFCTDFLS